MDSTTPEATAGQKLLAEVYPKMLKCAEDLLAEEVPGSLHYEIHIDASGRLRLLRAHPSYTYSFD